MQPTAQLRWPVSKMQGNAPVLEQEFSPQRAALPMDLKLPQELLGIGAFGSAFAGTWSLIRVQA